MTSRLDRWVALGEVRPVWDPDDPDRRPEVELRLSVRSDRRDEINRAARALGRVWGCYGVVLHGSTAREGPAFGRGLDLLAVGPPRSRLVREWWSTDVRHDLRNTWSDYGLSGSEIDVLATSPDAIVRWGPIVGSLERFALLEGRVVWDRTDDTVRWPDSAPPSATLLPAPGGAEDDRREIAECWLKDARERLPLAGVGSAGAATPVELAKTCQAAFWATHAALMALFAGAQRDVLWTYELALLGAQLPSELAAKEHLTGLEALQPWIEFAPRSKLTVTEREATELVNQARLLVRAAEHDLISLLHRPLEDL